MILPLKTTILKFLKPIEIDSRTVGQVEADIRDDQISDVEGFNKCTAFDPRFKALPHVDDACRDRITEIVTVEKKVLS